MDSKLLDSEGALVGRVPAEPGESKVDGPIRTLCQQTVDDAHSVLVFCATKKVSTSGIHHSSDATALAREGTYTGIPAA